jgi:hypothetical protein
MPAPLQTRTQLQRAIKFASIQEQFLKSDYATSVPAQCAAMFPGWQTVRFTLRNSPGELRANIFGIVNNDAYIISEGIDPEQQLANIMFQARHMRQTPWGFKSMPSWFGDAILFTNLNQSTDFTRFSNVYLSGFSGGGGIVNVIAGGLMFKGVRPYKIHIYNFSAAKAGDETLATRVSMCDYRHFANYGDPTPSVPPSVQLWNYLSSTFPSEITNGIEYSLLGDMYLYRHAHPIFVTYPDGTLQPWSWGIESTAGMKQRQRHYSHCL